MLVFPESFIYVTQSTIYRLYGKCYSRPLKHGKIYPGEKVFVKIADCISGKKMGKNRDNLYLIGIYLKHVSVFVCFFSYYQPLVSLHILAHQGTMKYTYILTYSLNINHVSPSDLPDTFIGIDLLWHYSKSF